MFKFLWVFLLALYIFSFSSLAQANCELKECGKSPPFQSLEELCFYLSSQNRQHSGIKHFEKVQDACHLSLKKEKVYFRDCEDKSCYHEASESEHLSLKGNQFDQISTFSLGDHPRIFLIATHHAKAWTSLGEFAILYSPGTMGQSDALKIDSLEAVQLLPGDQEEAILKFTYFSTDIDQGINRVSSVEESYWILCGLNKNTNTPFCSTPIPKKLKQSRTILFPESEKERCGGSQSSKCDKAYEHELATSIQLTPNGGGIKVSVSQGNVNWLEEKKKLAMNLLLKTLRIDDLPKLGK